MASSVAIPAVSTRRWHLVWLLSPCLVLVILHVLFALSRDRPLIFADEAGYIGNARYLAGGLPIKMLNSGAYYPGYSVILTPLFWLGLSAPQTYQAILILNGLLLSTAFISLVLWIRWILGDASKYGYAIAFAASTYPTFFVQPGFAMSESAVIALATALPLLGYWLLKTQRVLVAIAFAATTAFLYSIHPRFVGTVGTVVVGLGVLAVLRVLKWRITVVSWLVLGAGVVGSKALTAFVTAANGGGAFEASNRLATLVTGPGFWSLILEVLGQFWYLEVASVGLVLVGLVAIGRLLIQPVDSGLRRTSAAWNALLFTAISTVLAFGVSCAFMSEPRRVDHFIYGRYNEGVLAPVLATGIWAMLRLGKSWRSQAIAAAMIAAGMLVTAVVLHWARGDAWSGRANLANILSLIPYLKLVSGLKLVTISLVAFGLYVVIAVSAGWRAWLGLGLLSATFLAGSLLSQRSFLSMQAGRAKRQVLFDKVAALPGVDRISYDQSFFDPVTLFFGQYFLPNTEFDFFESARGETPKSSYVLSHEDWSGASSFSAQLIGKDNGGHSLWSALGCCDTTELPYRSLGSSTVAGVAESGFYATENWPIGPVRWTNGDASLRVPIKPEALSTSSLYVDLVTGGQPNNHVAISANGKNLFNGSIGRGRSRLLFSLAGTQWEDVLELTIKSKIFVPAETSDSKDMRQLGVAIRSIRIIRECCLASHDPLAPVSTD
jgi:hypothetical protein